MNESIKLFLIDYIKLCRKHGKILTIHSQWDGPPEYKLESQMRPEQIEFERADAIYRGHIPPPSQNWEQIVRDEIETITKEITGNYKEWEEIYKESLV